MMYIIDSSAWVALFLENDTQHATAVELFGALDAPVILPYCVISEVSTVLAYKHSKQQADLFMEYIDHNRDIIKINNDFEVDINFFRSLAESVSFTDASIIHLALSYPLSLISFDKQMIRVYKRQGRK